MKSPFLIEELSQETNSYELKLFRVQHDETQLVKYLVKQAKLHIKNGLNKIFLIRHPKTKTIVSWFGLKTATLSFNDKNESFLIPAIELTLFAVDERFKTPADNSCSIKTGEFIFWNYIIPITKQVASLVACKDLFVFSLNEQKLLNYYKTKLGFKEIKNIDDKDFFEYAVPDYDADCKFLYFPLSYEIKQED